MTSVLSSRVHVDPLVRRPVHLRVLLGRADQRGDPAGGVLDVAHQLLGLQRVPDPVDAWSSRPGSPTLASTLVQAVDVEAALGEDRREVPAAGDPCSSIQSPSSSSRSAACIAVSLGALAARSMTSSWSSTSASSRSGSTLPRPACRACAASRRPAGAAPGGPDGGRGRVVQLVHQPGRQRAEREQPLPLADRRLGVAHAQARPSSRWIAIGNHSPNRSPNSAAGREKNSVSVTECTEAA
jgi:hypothetical protein